MQLMLETKMLPPIPLFDGHNDTLLRLVSCTDSVASFQDCAGAGQLDLGMARNVGLAGGLFACFVPPHGSRDAGFSLTAGGYSVEMPDPPALAVAKAQTDAMIACAHRLEAELPGEVAICLDVPAIRRCLASGTLAMVLHLEGGEAIDEDLDGLEAFYKAGVRSIGPVWSRSNHFGTGVPFRYPGTPDLGPGLSAAGLALVRACDELGVMLDLSHLNAAGFWDVARASRRPLVATHSNAHAICPVPRNLTDDQLRAMRDSGGLVGVSLSVSELRPDGHNEAQTPLAVVLRHIEHLLAILGPDGVAIGSDLDGALLPAQIGDAGGLSNLVAAMQDQGYDPIILRKLCWGAPGAHLERPPS
jgi:membrane dipeptidase